MWHLAGQSKAVLKNKNEKTACNNIAKMMQSYFFGRGRYQAQKEDDN